MIERNQVENLEKAIDQIEALHNEISLLAKKSPDGGVNKFKLKFINDIVEIINQFLGGKYIPFSGFDGFDADDVPSNSDVTFIIAQYREALERFRSDNIESNYGKWRYRINDEGPAVMTGAPRKITKK